jgi:hypothetical protein
VRGASKWLGFGERVTKVTTKQKQIKLQEIVVYQIQGEYTVALKKTWASEFFILAI